MERFGIQLIGSVRHADALLITGAMNPQGRAADEKDLPSGAQTLHCCCLLAICALSQHMFRDSYNVREPLDKILPVDVYIPGCPPKPEAIISGIMKALDKLKTNKSHGHKKQD